MDQELKEMLIQILGKLETMDQRLSTIEIRLDALEQRLVALEQRLIVLEQRLDALEQRLIVLEQRLIVLEQQLDALEQRMVTIEEKQEDQRKKQMSMEGKLNGIDSRLKQFMAETNQNFRNAKADAARIQHSSDKLNQQIAEVIDRQATATQHQIDLIKDPLHSPTVSSNAAYQHEDQSLSILEPTAVYLPDLAFGVDQNTLEKLLNISSETKPWMERLTKTSTQLFWLAIHVGHSPATTPMDILNHELEVLKVTQIQDSIRQHRYLFPHQLSELCQLAKEKGLDHVEEKKSRFLEGAPSLLSTAEVLFDEYKDADYILHSL